VQGIRCRTPRAGSRREAILALLKKCDEKRWFFFLLSGGGSALVELPLDRRRRSRTYKMCTGRW